MSKDSLAKYYQDNKEILNKETRERYQSLSKEEKEKKTHKRGVSNIKNSLKVKNKDWLSVERNITKWEKTLHYN